MKVAWTGLAKQRVIANVQPEYEDCAELARDTRSTLARNSAASTTELVSKESGVRRQETGDRSQNLEIS